MPSLELSCSSSSYYSHGDPNLRHRHFPFLPIRVSSAVAACFSSPRFLHFFFACRRSGVRLPLVFRGFCFLIQSGDRRKVPFGEL
ncbi:hypothetical protein PanWU01x14_348790 [Parasponia andersonii]|uniref:Uncharacterized protein n=1 Tax=Parasponia andersonii TaxID=3476 RepID=A0A2P5ABK1_PARAD|nr:hypothetical protein PanWU01x14_348790 [Parasponia andersonii]